MGAGLVFGVGAGLTALGLALNNQSRSESLSAQRTENEKNRDFQASENEKQRLWQENFWNSQFEAENAEYERRLQLEQDQWQRQFDITNAYSSPSAQVARLRAAGFNPALSGNSGVGVPSFSPSVSSPSVGSPSLPSASVSPSSGLSVPFYDVASQFSSVAQLADSVSKLQTSDVNKQKFDTLIQHEVDNITADTDLKRSQSSYQDVMKLIEESTGKDKRLAEIGKLFSEAYQCYSLGDLNKASELNQLAMERLNHIEGDIKLETKSLLLSNMAKQGQLYDAQRSAAYASANASNASANYMNELSKTESALRSGRVTALDLQNGISTYQKMVAESDAVVSQSTKSERIGFLIQQVENMRLLNAQSIQQLRKMVSDNDWNGVEHALGCLGSAVGSVANVGNMSSNMLNSLSNVQRNTIQASYVELMRQRYGLY